jgi:hypothetical protein
MVPKTVVFEARDVQNQDLEEERGLEQSRVLSILWFPKLQGLLYPNIPYFSKINVYCKATDFFSSKQGLRLLRNTYVLSKYNGFTKY